MPQEQIGTAAVYQTNKKYTIKKVKNKAERDVQKFFFAVEMIIQTKINPHEQQRRANQVPGTWYQRIGYE